MKIDYIALWNALRRNRRNPRAMQDELDRQAREWEAKVAREERLAREAERITVKIRYRNLEESGGVDVEPEG